MKKLTVCIMAVFLSLTFIPIQMNALTESTRPPVTTPKVTKPLIAYALQTRLDEINALDKSHMKSSEKRALRKEVKSIKKSLNSLNGGVYLSVGAIIIIVLLLIILL